MVNTLEMIFTSVIVSVIQYCDCNTDLNSKFCSNLKILKSKRQGDAQYFELDKIQNLKIPEIFGINKQIFQEESIRSA